MTETTFKTRYANHKQSFKHEKYKNQTELSKHIWSLKEQSIKYTIPWKIMQHAHPYNLATKHANCVPQKNISSYADLKWQHSIHVQN